MIFRTSEDYYPWVFLQECKCVVKEKNLSEYITDKKEKKMIKKINWYNSYKYLKKQRKTLKTGTERYQNLSEKETNKKACIRCQNIFKEEKE